MFFEYLSAIKDFFKGTANTGQDCCICGSLLYGIYALAILVGTLQLLNFAYGAYKFVERHFVRPKDLARLRERYNKEGGAWAVITGASDGIGAEYAILLAEQGFNVCLVARTESKLKEVEKRVKAANPAVKTQIEIADFSNSATKRNTQEQVMAFYTGLRNKLDGLNIAILINNAGVMYTGRFDSCPTDPKDPLSARWKDMLDINIMQVGMMTSLFKDKLEKRQAQGPSKSAIINVASAIGNLQGTANCAVYSASKAYVQYLTSAAAWELKGKLDMQNYNPNLTRTNLLHDITQKASPLLAIPARDAAYGSLRDLGYDDTVTTSGDIRHDVQIPPYRLISELPITQWVMGYMMEHGFKH